MVKTFTVKGRMHQLTSSFALIAITLIALASTCFSQTPPGVAPKTLQSSPPAKARTRLNLNQDWKFIPQDVRGAESYRLDDSKWATIKLPHTWNADDTQDDVPGYRQGASWYRKTLSLDNNLRRKRLFLYFEGANQVADVFVNGLLAGHHVGGYSAFAFDVTDLVRFDPANTPNIIAVRVDNSINSAIPPAPSVDFNLYGGIYRDVWLVATDPIHITVLDHASPGIYVDTPTVSDQSATVRVRGSVINDTNEAHRIRVVGTVVDHERRPVSSFESMLTVQARGEASFQQLTDSILQPRLWSPDSPYLYTVNIDLYEGTRPLDHLETVVGFRWFSFDAAKGFFLNGKAYKLRGVNRHQDYKGMGNAVPNELQAKDLELIKGMGMNCVLLAHYPQDPVVLQTADRIGLIVWEEVPILREIGTSDEFVRNSKLMLTEMIRQHYNHPSIVMWCYMNEIFLRGDKEQSYVNKVVALAKELDELARREDPGRITVISANRNEIYNTSGLADIPQVFGWHMYFGWYYGTLPELGTFLDEQHRRYPGRKIFVSEYGADSDSRVHSLNPIRADYSTEWAQEFHQSYLQQLEARPYLAGLAVWNAFDFGSETRGESVPHTNKKGLFTYDRQPKDISYFYRASFTKDPVLHIATREWSRRTGTSMKEKPGESSPSVAQPVEVYSNLPAVELFLNGKTLGMKQFRNLRANTWDVPLRDGVNVIEARGQSAGQQVSDRAEIRFAYRAPGLKNSATSSALLAVNVGSSSQFTDAAGLTWEADQAYTPGSWGYVGGSPGKTDQNILGTKDHPLYRTFRKGLRGYRFDLPDGNYEIELRFVEPNSVKVGQNVFSITGNQKTLADKLDLAKEVGTLHVASRNGPVQAANGKGIELNFQADSGETRLSAVRIRRLP